MTVRLWILLAAAAFTISCTRQARTERLMTWAEERHMGGRPLPPGERVIVLRFLDDPGQGVLEGWNPALYERLTRLGNPIRVQFACWRLFDGTFGFRVAAIGGEPFLPGTPRGPSGSFTEGSGRPYPLESTLPE